MNKHIHYAQTEKFQVQIFSARSNQLKYFVVLLEHFEYFHSNDRIKNLHFFSGLEIPKKQDVLYRSILSSLKQLYFIEVIIQYTGWAKKVRLAIFAITLITLSTVSQFSYNFWHRHTTGIGNLQLGDV